MRRKTAVLAFLAAWAAGFVMLASHAIAQQTTCSSFTSQPQAQTFYDQHRDQTQLDGDGDGVACEGLTGGTTSGGTTSPQTIPNNGAETGVMALSGLSLVEVGYGLTLVARRYGVKRRAIPMYLLRKLVSAGKAGAVAVPIADDVYLVHESALTATVGDFVRTVDSRDFDEPLEIVLEEDDPDEAFRPVAEEPEDAGEELDADPWADTFSWRV